MPGISGQGIRLATICAVFLGVGLALAWRLYTFQVVDNGRFLQIAHDERRVQMPIIPQRGNMLDARGHPLAMSVPYDGVYVFGPFVGKPDQTAEALAPVLGMPAADIRAKIDPANQRQVVVKSRITSAASVQVQQLNLPGVYLQKEPIREYPEGSTAAQVLGFVGADFEGLSGLELSYDEELAGIPGVIDTERDSNQQEIVLGRRIITPPVEGKDLVLTIDRYVQSATQRLLDEAVIENKAQGGLIIVMDPKTGDIIAVANNPTYSLTDVPLYKPEQDGLYKPTIVTNQFEPGSTMKLITMATGIDLGIVNPNTTMDDTGVVRVGGATIRNWNGVGNGRITMTELLIYSSNVGAQWLSGIIGPERFYQSIRAFGFGQPTGVRLPGEVSGTVRTHEDSNWTRIDLATNSYGQGIAVTPLQLLTAVASLGNDGMLMQPRLVREIRGQKGTEIIPPRPVRQAVSPATAQTLLDMMEEVAQQDAYKEGRVPGYRMGLKTGTADTPTNLGYDTSRTFASITAIFPVENPRFAALVRLDGPEALYGGLTAAPVMNELARELFDYYRIPPSQPNTSGALAR